MTYQDLIDYLNAEGVSVETTFFDEIAQYINNAELKMQRDIPLDNYRVEDSIGISAGGGTATISSKQPEEYIATQYVRIQGGNELLQKDISYLDDYDPSRSMQGTPRYYALTENGSLRFVPKAIVASTLIWGYKASITPLSVSNTTNWFSTYVPDLYRAAMMIEVGIFNKLDEAELTPYYNEYTYRLRSARRQVGVENRNVEYRKGVPQPDMGGA
jgi:hypothetical protein